MDVQDTMVTYHTRYCREQPGSTMPRVSADLFDLGYLAVQYGAGDNGTFFMILVPPRWDKDFTALRHDRVWEGMIRSIPELAPRLDPTNSVPLSGVNVMGGLDHTYKHFCVEETPVVERLLALGDALCTTNPLDAWDASMAVTHACAAADAVKANLDDPAAVTAAYFKSEEEADAVYRNSSASDRLRGYQWKGEPIPEHDANAAAPARLLQGVMDGMWTDSDLLRACLARSSLLDSPDATFNNDSIMAKARAAIEHTASHAGSVKEPLKRGPSRDEAIAIIRAAAPSHRALTEPTD